MTQSTMPDPTDAAASALVAAGVACLAVGHALANRRADDDAEAIPIEVEDVRDV